MPGLLLRSKLVNPSADPVAGIVLTFRLQTHNGNNVPLGLYKDTASTIPATTAGDSIAAWRDELNGSGFAALQDNATKRPTLQFVNGKPVVRFDGVNDHLIANGFYIPQPYTAFAGLRLASIKHRYVLDSGALNMGAIFSSNGLYGTGWGIYANSAGTPGITTNAINTSYVIASVASGTSATFTVNGTVFTASQGIPSLSGLSIASANGLDAFWHGDMTSVLLAGSALDATSRSIIETYLATLNP